MKYTYPITAKCPKCGHENVFHHRGWKLRNNVPVVVTCDCDDSNGCEENFVIVPRLTCTADVYEMTEATK